MEKWIEIMTVEKLIQILKLYKDKKREFIYEKERVSMKLNVEGCLYKLSDDRLVKNALIQNEQIEIQFAFNEIDSIFSYNKLNKKMEIKIFDSLKLNIWDVELFDVTTKREKLDGEKIERYKDGKARILELSKYEFYSLSQAHHNAYTFKVRKELFDDTRCFFDFMSSFCLKEDAVIRIAEDKFIVKVKGKFYIQEASHEKLNCSLLNLCGILLEFKFKILWEGVETDFYISNTRVKSTNEQKEVYMKIDGIFDLSMKIKSSYLKYMEGFQEMWKEQEEERKQVEADYWSGLSSYERECIINMCEK